jgi:hypothetical protein
MLTVLTQRPPLLSGNWDESYWREPSPTEFSAAIEAPARRSTGAFEAAIIADYEARTPVDRELLLRLASLL